MQKPDAISQLLEDLNGEAVHSDVDTHRSSRATLYLNEEDKEGILLEAAECRLLFANCQTTERFIEAVGNTDEASLTFYDIAVPANVLEMLERNFVAIDEG